MARSLAQALTRFGPISTSTRAARVVTLRHRSTAPEKLVEGEIDVDDNTERITMKKLDDAVHRVIVKRSEPNWLPFVPGGSYWVPPESRSRGLVDVVAKLAGSSTNVAGQKGRMVMGSGSGSGCGWPASAEFFKGAPLEGEITPKRSSPSEDEEK